MVTVLSCPVDRASLLTVCACDDEVNPAGVLLIGAMDQGGMVALDGRPLLLVTSSRGFKLLPRDGHTPSPTDRLLASSAPATAAPAPAPAPASDLPFIAAQTAGDDLLSTAYVGPHIPETIRNKRNYLFKNLGASR